MHMKREPTKHYMKGSLKKDREKGVRDKPFLDVVAGTSIGAINVVTIVSYVAENNTREGSGNICAYLSPRTVTVNRFCRAAYSKG